MKAIELLEKLKTKTTFRIQDLERITNYNRKYARLTLHRLKKKKLIKQVAKNTYTTKDNIFLVASNITYPSYISFWSASYFLGYTEQIINTVQVATTVKKKPILFKGYKIKFIPIQEFFGYKKIHTSEGDIFLVEDEKLVIDVFLRPKECGNYDEITKVFKNAKISEKKLISYLKKVNNQTILKRVGFLLEKIKKIDISDSFKLDRNYVLANPYSKKWNKINKKWRVKI